MIPEVRIEHWLARRLGNPALFCGTTTANERRDILRATILERGIAHAIVGKRKDAPCETWSQLYRRLYGEDL